MRAILGFGLAGLIFAATGCSDHPVTTGAAAYWEVAHVEEVAARTDLQEDAAEAFYPSPQKFEPTWDRKADYSTSGAHGVEHSNPKTGHHDSKTNHQGGTVRSGAIPEPAGPQKSAPKAH